MCTAARPGPCRPSPWTTLVGALGWAVVTGTEGGFLKADTGWALSRTLADFSSDHGALTKVSFRVTDVLREPTPWRADFLSDAFAAAATAMTTELGAPTAQTKKSNPKMWWELPNGGRCTLSAIESSVSVTVHSAEYAGILRGLGD